MNNYDGLKLAVYESGLDFVDACEVIDIMESCDDDRLNDVIASVLELVEESESSQSGKGHVRTWRSWDKLTRDEIKNMSDEELDQIWDSTTAYIDRRNKRFRDYANRKIDKAARPYKAASATAIAAGGSMSAIYTVKLRSLKKELKKYCEMLKHVQDVSEQRKIEAHIDKLQNEIRKTERKLKAGMVVAGAGIGARAAVLHKTNKEHERFEKRFDNWENSR